MGNYYCCPSEKSLQVVTEKLVYEPTPTYVSMKVVKVQSVVRRYLSRKHTQSKRKKTIVPAAQTPDGFFESTIPGQIISVDTIAIDPRIIETEKKLGEFVIEEKELIRYIEENKYRLKNCCLKYEDGSVYVGYFNKYWMREGYGILLLKDGSKYQGFFKENKMNGRGRLVGTKGDYYEGEFKDDKAHIFGKYVNAEGGIYVGQWKDDKQEGTGQEVLPDGSRYEGSYVAGMKTGQGKLVFPDGSLFQGTFHKNMIKGYGIYLWRDGREYSGHWKDGKMEGEGIFKWPDKKKYIGQYKDDKKEGYGIFMWPDKKRYEGEWKNGKQHGLGIFSSEGIIKFGLWKRGKKEKWLEESDQQFQILKALIQSNVYDRFDLSKESDVEPHN